MGAKKSKPKLNKDIGKHKECEVGLMLGHKDFKTGGNFYLGYKSQTKKKYKQLQNKEGEEDQLQTIKEEDDE